jgi:hypothetical protein
MALKLKGLWSTAILLALVAGLSAQAPSPAPAPAAPQQVPPNFRVQIDAVTMDVIVKDDQGRFVPDLRKDEFEVFEDGVKQEITSMTMSHGGRVTNVLEAPPPPPPEGIILPPVQRSASSDTGRVFLFFVDDLHLQFQNSGRVRELFKKIAKNLVHQGDLFGVVSSGPSSIAIVDRDRCHLRSPSTGRRDQQDCRQRLEAERDHRSRVRLRGAHRASLQRARRLFDHA